MRHGTEADYRMLGPVFEHHTRGAVVDNLLGLAKKFF